LREMASTKSVKSDIFRFFAVLLFFCRNPLFAAYSFYCRSSKERSFQDKMLIKMRGRGVFDAYLANFDICVKDVNDHSFWSLSFIMSNLKIPNVLPVFYLVICLDMCVSIFIFGHHSSILAQLHILV